MSLTEFYPYPVKRITLVDHDCAYVDEGKGVPMVFLHGFSVNLTVFSKNYPRLSRTRRVVGLDYPGYYLSEKKEAPYDIPFMAEAVSELIDKLSLKGVVLVGSSMGGAIAIETARRRPDKISAVVLAAPAGFVGRRPFLATLLTLQQKVSSAAAFRKKFFERLFGRVDTFFANKKEQMKDEVVAQYTLMGKRDDFGLWIDTLAKMAKAILRVDSRAGLSQISAPVLLFWGDADEVLSVDGVKIARTSSGDNLTVEVIPGAGHLLFAEKPDLFDERVDSFLKAHNL
jgi:pimeloyl-ACP methyl ester carboxylesterase